MYIKFTDTGNLYGIQCKIFKTKCIAFTDKIYFPLLNECFLKLIYFLRDKYIFTKIYGIHEKFISIFEKNFLTINFVTFRQT